MKEDVNKNIQSPENKYKADIERLTTTLASIGDGVITTDLKGRVVFLNKTAEELTGWELEEAKGRQIDEIFRIIDKETNRILESPFSKAMSEGAKSGLKKSTVLLSKDGNEYFISASNSPIRDKNSKITGLITVFRDITRIRKIEIDLENEQKRLKAIFDAAPISILIVDENIAVQNTNETFINTFNVSHADILGKGVGRALGCEHSLDTDYGCGSNCACHGCRMRTALEGVISSSETVKGLEVKKILNTGCHEVEHCFRINAVPLLLGEKKYAVVVIDDITEYRRLEENLVKSRDYYLTLFEKFPAMIWRADCSKKCNYFNERWLDFTGHTMEEEIGDGWTKGVHPEDIEACFKTYSEAFDAREPFEMEYRLKNRNGQYRWILDIGRPFYDMDNNFSGYMGTCFDITERKIAEEGLRKYQLLSRNANDIILFADVNGYVIEANDAAVRAFGYEKENLLGKSIFYLVSPDPRSPIGPQPYQANTSGIYYEATAYRKDKSTFTAEVSMQGAEIGDGKVLMAIMRDSTERKRINEELKKAKESAEAASYAKSEFLANMSHEIRTPLNGIIGMIDLTLLTGLTEEQKDNLYTAKECAGTLLNLINDILDFSKIEAGKLTIENINFNIFELVEQAVKPHIIKAREKELKFQYIIDDKIPQVVNGDPYRLKQVINNLVSNAVKFTDSGNISLSACLAAKSSKSVMLEFMVSDTGIGIAPEDMQHLFNTFSQIDSSHTRKYGGTGLGLAISRQLIEKMNGTIWVESEKGKGSSFYFTVKLGIGDSITDMPRYMPSVSKTQNPLQILLVEDEKVNQMVIARMIQETGHKIITASNGKEALQILNEKEIDIVLMDIQMPEMDGIETTKRIRMKEASTGNHIPIIAITAYALQGEREKFLSVGMDGYISKPIQMKAFLDEIEKAARRVTRQKQNGETTGALSDNNTGETETGSFMLEYSKRTEPIFREITANIELMKKSFEKNDLTAIERYAHKTKMLSSEISAGKLKTAIFKVELAVRKGNIAEAAEHFARVTEELMKYEKHLKI